MGLRGAVSTIILFLAILCAPSANCSPIINPYLRIATGQRRLSQYWFPAIHIPGVRPGNSYATKDYYKLYGYLPKVGLDEANALMLTSTNLAVGVSNYGAKLYPYDVGVHLPGIYGRKMLRAMRP